MVVDAACVHITCGWLMQHLFLPSRQNAESNSTMKVRTATEPARAMLASGWETMRAPEPIKALVAGPTALRAIAADGKHLKCPWPCRGAWKEVPGQGGSLAESAHQLYHLSDSGQLSVSQPC